MSGRGLQKTCPMLMNYFARELRARWSYDEFANRRKNFVFVCVLPPQGGAKKLFENLVFRKQKAFCTTSTPKRKSGALWDPGYLQAKESACYGPHDDELQVQSEFGGHILVFNI